ncbi:DUF4240 domain-containing protein [Xanthobacteraceae bacterium A53D]
MTAIVHLAPRRSLAAPADAAWFWSIIERTLPADEDDKCGHLAAHLQSLSDQDLVDFIGLFRSLQNRFYSWRLWAAAYLINGGCGDDGFIDFRSWLISRGQAVAEAALRDPDTLAEEDPEEECASFEEFAYVMLDAFRARSGGVFPGISGEGEADTPADPDWDFDFEDEDEMRRRLPRLAEALLD